MAKISLDVDGVLSRFDEGVIRTANRLWPGKFLSGYQPPDWYWTDSLTKDEWDAIWVEIKKTPNFWSTLPAYINNVHALALFLREEKDQDIFYVTSRAKVDGYPISKQTMLWLNSLGVYHQNNQFAILPVAEGTPAPAKVAVMAALGIEYSVDDYLPTVVACGQIPGHKAFLLDRSWNRKGRPDDVRVVHSLQEYFAEIRKGSVL